MEISDSDYVILIHVFMEQDLEYKVCSTKEELEETLRKELPYLRKQYDGFSVIRCVDIKLDDGSTI